MHPTHIHLGSNTPIIKKVMYANFFFLASCSGVMVCAAIIRVIGTRNVEVTHVATHPDHVKHGHCTVLLRAIMDNFSGFNVSLITLTSTTDMVSL